MLRPLFTGALNGLPLRLFEAPPPHPAFPWPSYDDLIECLGLPRRLRARFLRVLSSSPGPRPRVLLTDTGRVRTIPHRDGLEVVEASIELGACEADAVTQYIAIAVAAMSDQVAAIPEAEEAEFYCQLHLHTHGVALPLEALKLLEKQFAEGS